MGNSDIREFAVLQDIEIDDLSGTTVAVDAPNWLYKYLTTTAQFTDTESYTTADGTELPNMIGVPRGIKKFIEYNITPVFVFDGSAHEMKAAEIKERREKRESAEKSAKDADTKEESAKYQARSQHINEAVIKTTKQLLDRLDIQYCTAPRAAEAQTAHMTSYEEFDHAVSEDYDSLLFGATSTVRDLTSAGDTAEKMLLEKTLTKHSFTRRELVNAAILCGTDYNDGVYGIGPKTSLKAVKEHDTLDDILAAEDAEVEKASAIQDLFMKPPRTNDWPEPTQPVPDTSAVRSYLKSNGIDLGEVEPSLKNIENESGQRGLSSF